MTWTFRCSSSATPAEEKGNAGGKIVLLEGGAFNGIHAAMMVHPHPYDVATPQMSAAALFDVLYTGKGAHSAAWPWLGINAADALVVAQTAIGLLRQHVEPSDRIHGIVTKGGDAPNIVPAHTSARYMVRSPRIERAAIVPRSRRPLLRSGGVGDRVIARDRGRRQALAQVEHDAALAAVYARNATALGRTFTELDRASGSTDMGNVSLVVPSIHPFIGIESLPAVNHQHEFAAQCARPPADKAVIDGAIAMAWTVIDIANDQEQRARLVART